MRKGNKPTRKRAGSVIRLEDLVPQNDPKGGTARSGKAVFGEQLVITDPEPELEEMTGTEKQNETRKSRKEVHQ